MGSVGFRLSAATVAAVILVGLAFALVPDGVRNPADAQAQEVTPARATGENRVVTAANLATLTFEESAGAVLVTGSDFPDALAGSYAAGRIDGPLLLVSRDHVPQPTQDALVELGVEAVTLLGGTAAVSEGVEARLEEQGYSVNRIAGEDRYETAARIALHYDFAGELVDGDRTAILASGEAFPDALSAGPLAAKARLPLLLTPADHTHPSIDAALSQLDIERIIIIGGEAAISGPVEGFYRNAGYTVERISGADRTSTAAAVADHAIARLPGFEQSTVLLARGDDFPDALSASIHGAHTGSPILLTVSPDTLGGPSSNWLSQACPEVQVVRALGGTAAVSAATLDAAVRAAEACLAADEEVARFTTPLPPNPDRTHNIHLAADYIDGDVIPAGATYSLDNAIGDRSAARGFRVVQNGCIGEDGQMVDCRGGGISQLATTFMNVVWFAGLQFDEFRPHTVYFERYPMCREATLARHQLDVRFVNDSPYDVTVDTFYADDFIGVRFLSIPWAEVESWTGDPYHVDHHTGAFSVDCGRTIHYPDGTSQPESYTWRYDRGYPQG